jgi:hypothetical protein
VSALRGAVVVGGQGRCAGGLNVRVHECLQRHRQEACCLSTCLFCR